MKLSLGQRSCPVPKANASSGWRKSRILRENWLVLQACENCFGTLGLYAVSFVIDLHVRVDKRTNQANFWDYIVLDLSVISGFRCCKFPALSYFNEG